MCVSKLLVLTMYFFYGKLSSEVAHVCFTCDTFLIFGGYVICIASQLLKFRYCTMAEMTHKRQSQL